MDYTSTIIIALVAIIVLGFLVLSFKRKKSRSSNLVQSNYIDGLNLMITGDWDQALEKLRTTVRLDTEFIDAYIKIADILRSKNASDNATKIYRDLLVRPNLTKKQQIEINKGLAKSFKDIKQYAKALDSCTKVLTLDKNDKCAKGFKLDIYEEMGDWQNAFDVVKKSTNFSKEERNVRLACYKVEQGRQMVDLKKEREARVRFRDAIKLNKQTIQAYLELSDSYMRENRASNALESLKKLVEKNEKFSGLAFIRLKQVLFEMGHFGELESFYRDIIKSNPEVVDVYLGLAEILEKKGEIRQAIEICSKGLTYDVDRMDIKLLLVRLQSKLGNDDKAAEIASELASQLLTDRNRFFCDNCGFNTKDYFWHCPDCKSWNSAKRGI